uniref:PD-(D/E)XK nuclease superfamily protein n=1 Tax=viral metagenome TaxID=1070528 RepID=A0A6M3LF92_9ZZZZ
MICPDCGKEMELVYQPSTTELLNGTLHSFLKLTKPYYVDPDSRAFMIAGSKHHAGLDAIAKELGLAAEVALSIDRDIFDLVELEEEGLVLTDYKLWGSFKVAMALGIVEIGKKPDPSGDVYKSSGKWGKAGSPKMIPEFGIDPSKIDNWEVELQLNRYRVMLEALGVKVNRMQIQVTVRDGGLYIANQRGVERNTYKIPVRIMDDEEVKEYFSYKDTCLKTALAHNEWEYPCTDKESWDGIRCKRFCDVADYCPKGILVKSIGGKDR